MDGEKQANAAEEVTKLFDEYKFRPDECVVILEALKFAYLATGMNLVK